MWKSLFVAPDFPAKQKEARTWREQATSPDLRRNVVSFWLLVVALSSVAAESKKGGRLRIVPDPIVVGSPFQLIGVIDQGVLAKGLNETIRCSITSDSSFILFLQRNANVSILSGTNAFKLDAIVLNCFEDLPKTFSAAFTCMAINKSDDETLILSSKTDVVNMRALPGSRIDAVVRSAATADDVFLRTSLENVVNRVPSEGVYCELAWDATVLGLVETNDKLTTIFLDERGQNVSIESQDKDVCEASQPSSGSTPPVTKRSCRLGNFIGYVSPFSVI